MVCSYVAVSMAEEVEKLRHMSGAKNIAWRAMCNLGIKCGKNCGRGLYILVVTAPCYGFGDIIFGKKFASYLRSWYGATVRIATTHVSGFEKIGEPSASLLPLYGARTECRRFARLEPERDLGEPDLIFIAPLQADLDPSLVDVRKLIPTANKFNTFFMSEYNPWDPTEFDFATGVGAGHVGIFISPPSKSIPRLSSLRNPYALAYLAESIERSDKCLVSFIEMVAAKYYKNNSVFEVVVPPWVANYIDEISSSIVRKVRKYFPDVQLVDKNKKVVKLTDKAGRVLRLRGDILPVSHDKMVSIIKWSVPDVLLTGDQSISDAVSCCPSKNIFYQIAPWKTGFGKALAEHLPNKYLQSRKTSCGSLSAVSYKSKDKNFAGDWDFKKLAKPKLDAIVLAALARRDDANVSKIEDMVIGSKKLRTLKSKIRDFVSHGC